MTITFWLHHDRFHQEIDRINGNFDLIISLHNIEHCNNPEKTFKSMMNKLKIGGFMYIVTPSLNSINFPSRKGGLCFYDDPTHKKPVDLENFYKIFLKTKIELLFFEKSYKPKFYLIIVYFVEFLSVFKNKILFSSYEYWGFEQIIAFKKLKN